MLIPQKSTVGHIHEVKLPSGEVTRTTCVSTSSGGALCIGPAIHIEEAIKNGWRVLLVAEECDENTRIFGPIIKHNLRVGQAVSVEDASKLIIDGIALWNGGKGLMIAGGNGSNRGSSVAVAILTALGLSPMKTWHEIQALRDGAKVTSEPWTSLMAASDLNFAREMGTWALVSRTYKPGKPVAKKTPAKKRSKKKVRR